MIKKRTEQDADGMMATLARFSRGRVAAPPTDSGKAYVAPSRRNRRSITTWQDEVALKQLRDISNKTGISQQALIAEGLNYVLIKYRKHTVAT